MPIDDTVSEAQAWDMASTAQSTIIDTYSEPPRCSGKIADKIMTRAYGGIDPEESIASSAYSKKGSSAAANTKSSSRRQEPKSVSSKGTSKQHSTRLGGSSTTRKARRSDESKVSSSSSSHFDDSSIISGRSQMSLLERRLESGRSAAVRASSSSAKPSSKRPDPNATLAIITRKTSVDPPSVAGSVEYFEDSKGQLVPVDGTRGHHYQQQQLVPVFHGDPPSKLSVCDEGEEETTTRRSSVSGTGSHYDSHSQETGSYDDDDDDDGDDTRSTADDDTGTIEDADDSMMASVADNALALREDDITVPTAAGESRALVARDAEEGGALVPHARYLASAVDNQAAMVPFDSTLFESYDHTFVKCPEDLRFLFLYTFLRKNADKKVIVFFSTTQSAKFHSRLLEHFHVPCLTMHSKQKKQTFINTFFKFSDLPEGILCATDAEGRDLDIPPSVDWVVQFEPPEDPTEYILRVSRISCDSDRVGRSLLFLNPGEQGFLKYYHSAAIPVSEFEIPKLADIQGQIEHHVNSSERFSRYAKDAYGSYLIAYASHSFRDVYNVHDLNKSYVAAAFGLVELPAVDSDDETSVASREVQREGQSAGQAAAEGSRKTWTSNKKPKEKSWLKGEKSWPHCKIKVHPKFREGYVPPKEEEYED
jgi:ATP-dependent RNA helicase DDX18/HAS1